MPSPSYDRLRKRHGQIRFKVTYILEAIMNCVLASSRSVVQEGIGSSAGPALGAAEGHGCLKDSLILSAKMAETPR